MKNKTTPVKKISFPVKFFIFSLSLGLIFNSSFSNAYEWASSRTLKANNQKVEDKYLSPRTSQLQNQDKVLKEQTLMGQFNQLNLKPYAMQGQTSTGHTIGLLIDFELNKKTAKDKKQIRDLQLYLQILGNEYDADIGNRSAERGGVFNLKQEKSVDFSFVYGTSLRSFAKFLKNQFEICRPPQITPQPEANAEELIEIFTDFKAKKKTLAESAMNLQTHLKNSKSTTQDLESLLLKNTNPFFFAAQILYPACNEEKNYVSIENLSPQLKVIQRGFDILTSNATVEEGLLRYFKNKEAKPLAVHYCSIFKNPWFYSGYGSEEDPSPLSLSYEPKKMDAFPEEIYEDPAETTLLTDVNSRCVKQPYGVHPSHAGVLKGFREVQLQDGSKRIDYLIEDINEKASNVPVWQNHSAYHYWVDAKTLSTNILEIAYIK